MDRPSKPRRPRPKPSLWTRRDWAPTSPLVKTGGSSLAMIRNGIVLPLIPVLYGLFPLLSGHHTFRGRGRVPVTVEGWPARAYGLAFLAVGACLHFYFYWENHRSLSEYGRPALYGAMLVLLGSVSAIAYYWSA